MKKSKVSDSRIISVLKQADNDITAPDLCREHAISSATF
jgi:putative transposase